MPTLLFYNNIVALSSEAHGHLRLNLSVGFGFAASTNAVPLTTVEFAEASKYYPIFFVRNPQGEAMPMAMLGLDNEENLFVDADGRWDAPYIPAFVRRYPFGPMDNDQPDTFTICVDDGAEMLSEAMGDPLFTESGEPSERLSQIIELIGDYQGQAAITTAFVKRLETLGLLRETTATFDAPGGRRGAIPGLMVVDEEKLLQLDDATALELFRSGAMGIIYTHLVSLGNLPRLSERRFGGGE